MFFIIPTGLQDSSTSLKTIFMKTQQLIEAHMLCFPDSCTRWIIWLTATNQNNLISVTLTELLPQQGMGLFRAYSQCIPGARDYLEWCNTGCSATGKSQQSAPQQLQKHSWKWPTMFSGPIPILQPRRIRKGRRRQKEVCQEGTVSPCATTLRYLFPKYFISHSCTKPIWHYLRTNVSLLSFLRPVQAPAFPDTGGLPV